MTMNAPDVHLFDTTLRDGTQTEGLSVSVEPIGWVHDLLELAG